VAADVETVNFFTALLPWSTTYTSPWEGPAELSTARPTGPANDSGLVKEKAKP
jgi:hypothetical protein